MTKATWSYSKQTDCKRRCTCAHWNATLFGPYAQNQSQAEIALYLMSINLQKKE